MIIAKTPKKNRRYFNFRLAALSVVGVLMCNAPAPAYTQPVVEIGPNVFQSIMNQINTYKAEIIAAGSKAQDAAEYIEQRTRWIRTLQQYAQQLIQLQAIFNDFGMPVGQTLTRVDDDYLVKDTCRTSKNMTLPGLLETFVFKSDTDFKSQQTQICVNIRMMRNRKYNDAVDFMNYSVPLMKSSLTRIFELRILSNNQGNVQGVDSESLRMANDLAVQSQIWEARMKSYDSYIEVMEANQKVVAEQALKGDTKNRMIGDIIRTATLAGALKIK
ncbi:hypothetical protein [Stenotrophomonas sp. PS02289]|uniref:hypothetical protein n=1 Tax=Stenotrophomonas sp. PS02289 TaxID=2991422 RepID=UPI00249BE2C0|nr:hypothetical protein [Stenotrophomonas sp. PS02289]